MWGNVGKAGMGCSTAARGVCLLQHLCQKDEDRPPHGIWTRLHQRFPITACRGPQQLVPELALEKGQDAVSPHPTAPCVSSLASKVPLDKGMRSDAKDPEPFSRRVGAAPCARHSQRVTGARLAATAHCVCCESGCAGRGPCGGGRGGGRAVIR